MFPKGEYDDAGGLAELCEAACGMASNEREAVQSNDDDVAALERPPWYPDGFSGATGLLPNGEYEAGGLETLCGAACDIGVDPVRPLR